MTKPLIENVPIAKIVSRGNVRAALDEEEQVARAKSIAEHGLHVALLGHREGDAYVVDDGHGRLDAARRAGLIAVPMLIADRTPTPAERITLQLVVNTQRCGLKVMELTRAIHDLMQATNWSAAEVSLKLEKPSPSTISKMLSLLVFSRDIQDLIDAGRIPMSSAYEIVKVQDAAERHRLVQEVLNGGLTRDRLARLMKERKADGSPMSPRKTQRTKRERVVIPLGGGRSVAVSAPTLTVESIVEWLTELVERFKRAGSDGRALVDVVRDISAQTK